MANTETTGPSDIFGPGDTQRRFTITIEPDKFVFLDRNNHVEYEFENISTHLTHNAQLMLTLLVNTGIMLPNSLYRINQLLGIHRSQNPATGQTSLFDFLSEIVALNAHIDVDSLGVTANSMNPFITNILICAGVKNRVFSNVTYRELEGIDEASLQNLVAMISKARNAIYTMGRDTKLAQIFSNLDSAQKLEGKRMMELDNPDDIRFILSLQEHFDVSSIIDIIQSFSDFTPEIIESIKATVLKEVTAGWQFSLDLTLNSTTSKLERFKSKVGDRGYHQVADEAGYISTYRSIRTIYGIEIDMRIAGAASCPHFGGSNAPSPIEY